MSKRRSAVWFQDGNVTYYVRSEDGRFEAFMNQYDPAWHHDSSGSIEMWRAIWDAALGMTEPANGYDRKAEAEQIQKHRPIFNQQGNPDQWVKG